MDTTQYAELLDRDEAKRLGITCTPSGYDRERSRLRTSLSPRLTHPHTVAQIESDIRDERYSLEDAA